MEFLHSSLGDERFEIVLSEETGYLDAVCRMAESASLKRAG